MCWFPLWDGDRESRQVPSLGANEGALHGNVEQWSVYASISIIRRKLGAVTAIVRRYRDAIHPDERATSTSLDASINLRLVTAFTSRWIIPRVHSAARCPPRVSNRSRCCNFQNAFSCCGFSQEPCTAVLFIWFALRVRVKQSSLRQIPKPRQAFEPTEEKVKHCATVSIGQTDYPFAKNTAVRLIQCREQKVTCLRKLESWIDQLSFFFLF